MPVKRKHKKSTRPTHPKKSRARKLSPKELSAQLKELNAQLKEVKISMAQWKTLSKKSPVAERNLQSPSVRALIKHRGYRVTILSSLSMSGRRNLENDKDDSVFKLAMKMRIPTRTLNSKHVSYLANQYFTAFDNIVITKLISNPDIVPWYMKGQLTLHQVSELEKRGIKNLIKSKNARTLLFDGHVDPRQINKLTTKGRDKLKDPTIYSFVEKGIFDFVAVEALSPTALKKLKGLDDFGITNFKECEKARRLFLSGKTDAKQLNALTDDGRENLEVEAVYKCVEDGTFGLDVVNALFPAAVEMITRKRPLFLHDPSTPNVGVTQKQSKHKNKHKRKPTARFFKTVEETPFEKHFYALVDARVFKPETKLSDQGKLNILDPFIFKHAKEGDFSVDQIDHLTPQGIKNLKGHPHLYIPFKKDEITVKKLNAISPKGLENLKSSQTITKLFIKNKISVDKINEISPKLLAELTEGLLRTGEIPKALAVSRKP